MRWSAHFIMSREPRLDEVRVQMRDGKAPPRNAGTQDFVYVNSAFVGSVNSVNNVSSANNTSRSPAPAPAPITGVYREQYWACSRWPYTQRVLAVTVGVLLGALIGLALSMVLGKDSDNVIGGIFVSSRTSVPD